MNVSRKILCSSIQAVLAVSAAVAATSATAAVDAQVYVPIEPCRIVETRNYNGFTGAGALNPGTPYTYGTDDTSITTMQDGNPVGCGLPSGISGIAVNLGMIKPSADGDIRAWPANATIPNSAAGVFDTSLLFSGAYSNVPVDGGGFFKIQPDNGSLYLTIDVVGYWLPLSSLPFGGTGATGPAGATGATGVAGAAGSMILSGGAVPTTQGAEGDYYIDDSTGVLYGPKTGGNWTNQLSLVGPTGAAGANGNSILSGNTPPTDGQGANGDYYIDGATEVLFGPKSGGTWSTAPQVSLIGPAGATGATGAAGSSGMIFMSSTSAASLSTILGGLVGTTAEMPVSGPNLLAVPTVGIVGVTVDLSSLLGVAQTFPKSGTFTTINGTFNNTVALNLLASTFTVNATLYTAPAGSLTATKTGLSCNASFNGLLNAFTLSQCVSTGGSATVNAGDTGVIVLSATATGALIATMVVNGSIGIAP